MPALSLPRFSYSTPYGSLAEGLTDFGQLAWAGGAKLAIGITGLTFSADANASPLSGLRKLIMPALGDSTQLVRMTNEGVAIVRSGDYAFSQIKLGDSTRFYRNELAKLNEMEPVVTNFRNAAQEVRDGYSFKQLSQGQRDFINDARTKYPNDPWVAAYRESAARGSFVDKGVGLKMELGQIPGADLYQKMSIGPDLIPRSGTGLKMEITNYTPSLNAVVTHAWRYPTETMPYVLYRSR
jgi:3',5'-cyclic AMP phosphodiesterase CpdA